MGVKLKVVVQVPVKFPQVEVKVKVPVETGAVGAVVLLLPGQPVIKKITPMRSEKIPAARSFIGVLKILIRQGLF